MAEVFSTLDYGEALFVQTLLEARKIPAKVLQAHPGTTAAASVTIAVPEEHSPAARKVIQEYDRKKKEGNGPA